VGLKEREAPRPVCYCFGHTVESIRERWRNGPEHRGHLDQGECGARECSCEVLNPKGICCLGDVNKVVKEALASTGPRNRRGPNCPPRAECEPRLP